METLTELLNLTPLIVADVAWHVLDLDCADTIGKFSQFLPAQLRRTSRLNAASAWLSGWFAALSDQDVIQVLCQVRVRCIFSRHWV